MTPSNTTANSGAWPHDIDPQNHVSINTSLAAIEWRQSQGKIGRPPFNEDIADSIRDGIPEAAKDLALQELIGLLETDFFGPDGIDPIVEPGDITLALVSGTWANLVNRLESFSG